MILQAWDHQSPEPLPLRGVFPLPFFRLYQTSDIQLIDMNVHVCLVIFSASNGTSDKVPSFYHISSFPSIYTIAYSYASVGMTHGSDVIVGCVFKQPHPEVIDFSKRTQWFDQGQQWSGLFVQVWWNILLVFGVSPDGC